MRDAFLHVPPVRRRQFAHAGVLLCTFIGVVCFSFLNEYNHLEGFIRMPQAIVWLFRNFVPDQRGWTRLPVILQKLNETFFLSVAAASMGACAALLFSILATRRMRVNRFLGIVATAIATISRNVPVAAWAMILLFSFGQNIMTGFFALFLNSFGFLTRSFREVIDETSADVLEAQRAVGATGLQMVFQGVIPCALPQMISWTLFMIETNIRNATLIGLLTGTGIGFVFLLYYQNLNYGAAGLVVVGLIVVILSIELLSHHIRRVIL